MRIFKRVIVAIAEPVAVAVAGAVEQTLRQNDDRLAVQIATSERLLDEAREARRDADTARRRFADLEPRLEAAAALARLAGKVVGRFENSMRDLPTEVVAELRKLDQLADVVLGQS